MKSRVLTGEYIIEGAKIKVQVEKRDFCIFDCSFGPEYIRWERASKKDLIELLKMFN